MDVLFYGTAGVQYIQTSILSANALVAEYLL